ncbi:MAG: alpha/beta fold hydrolase, partial [Nitrosopumilaceae archaeon]
MQEKSKFLKQVLLFSFIPLILSIGMAPAMSFGNIFGTPKKQMDDGVPAEDVLCRYGLDLMLRPSGDVACVNPTSTEKLTGWGWETLAEGLPTLPELTVVEKTIEIDGLTVSYKEGGSPDSPTILLLHGFPTSSHMFRNLIPALEDEFYLVAPDLIGYGKSSMPSVDEFDYTFDNQADIMNKFTEELGLTEYSMYMMDYGAPVGFRIFAEHPERVQAFIIQNGNAYEEGLETFWDDWKAWWNDKTPENEMKLHYLVAADTTKWQYTFGMRDPNSVDQSTWITDVAGLQREGNVAVQLAMAYDYRTNLPLYPQWQEKFREHDPPALITWGANDYIFPESGAHPYERDLTDVEKHILDTGHFVLE